MTTLLPAAALICAFAGYGTLLWNRIRLEFIPLAVCCCMTCALYLGALIGLLGPTAVAVLAVGCLLLARATVAQIVRRQRPQLAPLLSPGAIFFVVGCISVCILLQGARFVHYDNFSHWGLMAKHLALTNRLPSAMDLYIAFRSYPPGSALFIYLFTYALGFSESLTMMAQGIFMVAAVSCLFAFVRGWKSVLSIALIVFFAANCKSYLTYSLLVDTLLPLVAVGNAAIILCYRDDPKVAALLSLPVMATVLLIKSSGAFYAAMNGALLLVFLIRARRQGTADRRATATAILSLSLALLMLAIWYGHVYIAFRGAPPVPNTKAEQSKPSIADGPKTDDVGGVTARLMDYIFSTEKGSPLMQTAGWSGLVLAALLLRWAFTKRLSRRLLITFLAGLAASALYILGEYLMYLFIMPSSVSCTLSGIGRYTYALFAYISGLYVAVVCEDWLDDVKPASAAVTAICAALLCALVFDPAMFSNVPKYEGSLVQAVDEAFDGVETDDKQFVVYLPAQKRASLCKYIVRYKLMDATTPIVTEESEIEAAMAGRDQLIRLG